MKKNNTENMYKMDIDTLIKSIQTKDIQLKNITRSLQIVFFIFILFYAGFFLFNLLPKMATIYHRIAGVCYVLAFILFTHYFRKYHKKYKTVNYFEPVKKVLEDAELRYRFWHTELFSIGIAMLLIDVATFLIFFMAFKDKWTFMQIFLGVQGVYLFVIGISFAIGYIMWKKENRPIWISAKELLKELEE